MPESEPTVQAEEHFGPDNWAVSWLAGKHGAPHHDEASRAVALAMRAAFVAGFEQGREFTQQSEREEYGYKIDPDAFARLYTDDRRSLGVPIPVRNEWIKCRQRCPSDEEIAAFDDGYLAAAKSFSVEPTVPRFEELK